MGTKAYVGCGVFFAILGIALVIIGTFVLPKEDGKLMTNKLNEYLTVDSQNAQLYEQWAGGFDDELNYQMVFYFYNLTNAAYVLNGSVPEYTQHGPYIWRRHRKAVDVSFPDNGNQVQFSENTIYQFDEKASAGSDSDLFTNVNPAYVGAVTIAGGEGLMLVGATGGYLENITEYLTGDFMTLLGAYDFPSLWYPLYNGNINAINQTAQNTEAAEAQFFAYWANSTSSDNTMAGNWSSIMLLSYNGTSSNISLASAQALFAPANGSLLDPAAVDLWNQATYNNRTAYTVAKTFGLTPDQLQLVLNWRNNIFVPAEVYPFWVKSYDLDQPSDVGWLQFVWATPLGGQQVNTLFPLTWADLGYTPDMGFELMDSGNAFNSSDWRQVAYMFNPQTGLENLTIFQLCVNPLATSNPLNLTSDQVNTLFEFSAGWAQFQVTPNLLAVNGPTAGLIATKSIHDWVFNCHDRVIDLLRNPAPTCNMLFNDTTMPPNLLWTGKDDISKIDTYINFQGAPVVEGVFKTPLNISNQMIYTELGQFAPNLPVGGYLRPFDPHFMRPMQLNYTKNETILGLNSYRYVLDAAWVFAKDDNLFQEGIGFGNVTGAQNDSPIFLSLWDQLYVGQCFPPHNQANNNTNNATACTATYNSSASVYGQNPTNDTEDSAFLHIEPQTGVTLESWKRLQVNLLVAAGTGGGSSGLYTTIPGNSNITDNVYYPLSKAGEYVIVSQQLADQIKNKLGIVPKLNNAMFYVGVTVGPVFIVFGIILVAVGLRRKRRGYSAINE